MLIPAHHDLCRSKHMAVATNIEDVDGCDCPIIAKVRKEFARDLWSHLQPMVTWIAEQHDYT